MRNTIHRVDIAQKLANEEKCEQIAAIAGDLISRATIAKILAIVFEPPSAARARSLDHDRSLWIIRVTYDRMPIVRTIAARMIKRAARDPRAIDRSSALVGDGDAANFFDGRHAFEALVDA
jgi:hypothetical protein